MTQSVRKKRKEDDVTKGMMNFCTDESARKAAREMMEAMVGDDE